MGVLDLVKELEREGRWSELRERGEELLAQAPAVDHARVHAALSTACFWTAQQASDWRHALEHAHACNRLADPGSILHIWSYQKLSSLYVAIGRYDRAGVYSRIYMRNHSAFAALAPYTPHVLRDLGHIAFYGGRHRLAVSFYRRAIQAFKSCGTTLEVHRSQANLAWALATIGDTAGAQRVLPHDERTEHLRLGVLTLVLYQEGRLDEAIAMGRLALSASRPMPIDHVDAAEVAWIVALASSRLGRPKDAFGMINTAREFAALQGVNASSLAILNGRAGGGALPYVHAAASVGDCGFHPDCCLTTGIA